MEKKDQQINLIAASSSVNLIEQLNHQVEVRGTWETGAAGRMGAEESGSTSSTTASTPAAKNLRITSVRMGAATCS